MNETIERILLQLDKLTEQEREMVLSRLSEHWGTPVLFTREHLASREPSELELIERTLSGLLLTKENVPDIREAYERLKGANQPSRVSFGRIRAEDEPNEGN